MKINKWKIFGLTVMTWLVFSILANFYLAAMVEYSNPNYGMIDAQSVIWSWMSLGMGVVSWIILKKWTEFFWGILFSIVALIPILGFFAGIFYFAWSYVKFERRKLNFYDSKIEREGGM